MYRNFLIGTSALFFLCKKYMTRVERKLERKYRQAGCRPRDNVIFTCIIEKRFTHLKGYKEKTKLIIKTNIK